MPTKGKRLIDVLNEKREIVLDKFLILEEKIKSFNLPWGKIGLSICYDLRFPNLYRKLSKTGSILSFKSG